MGKDKVNVNKELFAVPQDLMENFPTGTTTTKVLKSASTLKRLVVAIHSRCVDFLLRRVSISKLDKAFIERTGKGHKRGAVLRAEAKGRREGRRELTKELIKKGYFLNDYK